MAVMLNGKCLILVVLLGSLYQSTKSQDAPKCEHQIPNMVVNAGNATAFQRQQNNETVKWKVIPCSEYSHISKLYKDITDSNGNVNEEFNTTYAVDGSQLTVFKATMDEAVDKPYPTAGLYTLKYPDCETSAILLVIKNGLECDCDGIDPNKVLLMCSVQYENSLYATMDPVLTWFSNTLTRVEKYSHDTIVKGRFYTASSYYKVGSSDSTPYQCQMTFGSPYSNGLDTLNTQPADFNTSCYVSNCAVVTEITTTATTTPTNMTTTATTMTTTATATHQTCTESKSPPKICGSQIQNMVVYAGNETAFERQDIDGTFQWTVAPSSEIFKTVKCFNPMHRITDRNGNVVSEFNKTYAVMGSQLTIFNSTVAPQGDMPHSTAGLYILDHPDCQTSANLVVIQNGPMCACDGTDPTNVKLSCSVTYASSNFQPMYPIMTWKNGIGAQVQQDEPKPSQINQYVLTSTSVYSVTTDDIGTFECLLRFSAPSKYPVLTVNMMKPNFTTSCFVSVPKKLENQVVYEGSAIAFTGDSNANPVQWQFIPSWIPASDLTNSFQNITEYDDDVVPDFTTTYAVNQSELSILNATVKPEGSMSYPTAGLYILNYNNPPSFQTAANLVVIKRGPVCELDSTGVKISCSVVYASAWITPMYPIMTWLDSSGVVEQEDQPVPTQINKYLQNSTSVYFVGCKDPTTLKCKLTFSAPTPFRIDYVNPQPPRFNKSCSIAGD